MHCRFCQTKVSHVFIDLIASPPSNSFLLKENLNEPEVYFPLKVQVCDKCFLVQLEEYKKSDTIFNDDYVYFSSYSTSWLKHAEEYVNMMIARFGYTNEHQVIEIASNDGYLLQYFLQKGLKVLGIEPTANTAAVAKEKGIDSIVDFFGKRLAHELVSNNMMADLILGNNVLAHVPDINDFVGGMPILLKEGGVVTMEFPHLLQLIKHNQFDTIYHEHFSYLSLFTVQQVFKKHGLRIFDVQEIPTHGGSLRIFAAHDHDLTKPTLSSVSNLLYKEESFGLNSLEGYTGFQRKAESIKDGLVEFLINAKKLGKTVVGYGAAAKGNTLMNFCGLKPDAIKYVVDMNPHKQNKFLPGTHIPVVNEGFLKEDKPDYVLILPWNIKEEVMEQLSYIREWGGQFIIAIPSFQIL